MTLRRHSLDFEKQALLTESAPELKARRDQWYAFFRPDSPGECELIDLALMGSILYRRTVACATAVANRQIRSAIFDVDCRREDEVQLYRDMLETRPGAAIVGLRRTALGCRFLIARWGRLLRLLDEEGTWYGDDRDEAIRYQGGSAAPGRLRESEGAYLTWIYCLMAQPDPKDEDFVALGDPAVMPPGLDDRRVTEQWLAEPEVCRRLLRQLAERELAELVGREELLRTGQESPERDGAETVAQVPEGRLGDRLARLARMYELQYQRSYNALVRGRERAAKTGRAPGAPDPEARDDAGDDAAADSAPSDPALESGRQRRRRDADRLAPGGAGGIGAPDGRGEAMRLEVHRSVKALGPGDATANRATDPGREIDHGSHG